MIRKCTEDMKRHFTKEDMKMANKRMKRYSPSLAIREMQVKTTHKKTPIRMAEVKNNL